MIGLDWLILDWCIGCFWETNMERAYHTSKTLKVNYVHHASFWWNHYIIHINRPKKLSQVSPNWPMPFQTYRFYWSIEVQDLNFRLQWYWWHCEVGKLKILAWFLHIGDKTRIASTCSPLNSCVLFLRFFFIGYFRLSEKIKKSFWERPRNAKRNELDFSVKSLSKRFLNFGENNLNCQFSPAYYANGFANRIHHFRQFW